MVFSAFDLPLLSFCDHDAQATKKKQTKSWIPSRSQIIVATLVAAAAAGYAYYKSLPPGMPQHRIREAEQAYLAANKNFQEVKRVAFNSASKGGS